MSAHMSPDQEKINQYRFYHLKGFNWMFSGSYSSADNNQQIVEGIALSFARYAGTDLDRVRETLFNVKNISETNAWLMVYTVAQSRKIHAVATSTGPQ